jgi:ATP-binding protein involved in chromosome partitioning
LLALPGVVAASVILTAHRPAAAPAPAPAGGHRPLNLGTPGGRRAGTDPAGRAHRDRRRLGQGRSRQVDDRREPGRRAGDGGLRVGLLDADIGPSCRA